MESDTDEDEDYDQGPRYSTVLTEEDYESDDSGPESYEKEPLQDNFEDADPSPEIEGWDPHEAHHNFFRLT